MAVWHHWLDGRESVWTLGVGDGQGGLACCDSWSHKESDTTERLNWLNWLNWLTDKNSQLFFLWILKCELNFYISRSFFLFSLTYLKSLKIVTSSSGSLNYLFKISKKSYVIKILIYDAQIRINDAILQQICLKDERDLVVIFIMLKFQMVKF